jgi:hypothetical protein
MAWRVKSRRRDQGGFVTIQSTGCVEEGAAPARRVEGAAGHPSFEMRKDRRSEVRRCHHHVSRWRVAGRDEAGCRIPGSASQRWSQAEG